ncbi:MAG TPA: lysylphosphatidylglycerol synthase transmembrane domain-containing protein [Aggregatilineales bacterium]|nr:lysylphosphatidylglycerol synthase transmembrane domain-containing protein [Aggregatilineales bacterium]
MDSNQPDSPRRTGKRWTFLLQIAVSAGLLIWLLSRVGLREVLAQLAGMDPWLYALAVVVYLLSVGVRAYRWQIMLRPLSIDASLATLFRLYLLGFFWNSFLPTGFGGDVAKVIALQRRTGQGVDAMTSVIAERLVGLLGTSLIGLVVLLAWPRLVTFDIFLAVALICVAIIAGGWLIRLDVLDWLAARLPFTRRIVQHPKLVAFHGALRAYDLRTLGLGLLSSLPFTLTFIVANWLIGLALHVDVPPHYFAVFTPVVSIVELVPLSFNGLGVREVMYRLLFEPVGVTAGQAVTMGLAFNLMKIGTGLLGGLVALLSGARGLLRSSEAPRP